MSQPILVYTSLIILSLTIVGLIIMLKIAFRNLHDQNEVMRARVNMISDDSVGTSHRIALVEGQQYRIDNELAQIRYRLSLVTVKHGIRLNSLQKPTKNENLSIVNHTPATDHRITVVHLSESL